MCWSITYHEKKISLYSIKDFRIYECVNNIENLGHSFQINKFKIKNEIYYDIFNNQCACDFFDPRNRSLQNEFICFLLKRFEIECVEPYILIKWLENKNEINIPNKIENINQDDLLNFLIFNNKSKEIYYCLKKEPVEIIPGNFIKHLRSRQ